MFVCCECCVLSGRGLCDGLITRPEKSYRLLCVVVCDLEISNTRRLKPATGLWKYNHNWLWRQENKQQQTIYLLLANINWGHLLTMHLTAQNLGTTLHLIFKLIKSCPNTTIRREHWDLCTEGMWFKCIQMCVTNIIANQIVPFNLTYQRTSSMCYFWNYSVFITYPDDCVVTSDLWPRTLY
jgi:hypothetical protein